MAPPTVLPEIFARAVSGLRSVRPRDEIALEEIRAPQRLAPYSFALGAAVRRDGEDVATGRLVLLHDPAGHDGWGGGTLRLVTYVVAELEPELAADALLPAVGWSWLVDGLESHEAAHTALAGTVTQTISTRFGDLADLAEAAANGDIEIRASWTPLDGDRLAAHLRGWCGLLSSTAGLPPPGVTALPERRPAGAA